MGRRRRGERKGEGGEIFGYARTRAGKQGGETAEGRKRERMRNFLVVPLLVIEKFPTQERREESAGELERGERRSGEGKRVREGREEENARERRRQRERARLRERFYGRGFTGERELT